MNARRDVEVVGTVCACGWQSGDEEPRTEEGDGMAMDEWTRHQYRPVVEPPRDARLLEGYDGGGRRHFLDGRPVHEGTILELLLPRGVWIPIRYEWDFDEGSAPEAVFVLGGPWERHHGAFAPQVSTRLPRHAVLRWPEDVG